MGYMNCPVCREKSVPVGGSECEFCGWKSKGQTVVDQKLTSSSVVDQNREDVNDKSSSPDESAKKQDVQAKPKKKSYKKVAPCVKCGKEGVIVARGLGGCCYHRESKSPDFDKNYPPRIKTRSKTRTQSAGKKELALQTSPPPATPQILDRPSFDAISLQGVALPQSDRDTNLFVELERWAEEERRTLPAQILYLLDEIVSSRRLGA